jgi:hypothetical protein
MDTASKNAKKYHVCIIDYLVDNACFLGENAYFYKNYSE